MKLTDIQAQSDAVISIDERIHIRRILGVSEIDSDTYKMDSETIFDQISQRVVPDGISVSQEANNIFRCKELRALYLDYDKLGDGNLFITGSKDGVNLSTKEDRLRLALQLWNRIFSVKSPTPNEPIFSAQDHLEKSTIPTNNGTFASVPVRFNDCEISTTEY